MSLFIIEISAVPSFRLFDDESSGFDCVADAFAQILTYVSSLSASETTAIEIMMGKDEDSRLPQMYLLYRQKSTEGHEIKEEIALHLAKFLSEIHYSVEFLTGNKMLQVVKSAQKCLSSNLFAIRKRERLVASRLSYSGYYYYTDIWDKGCEQNSIVNYSSTIKQLINCKDALVSFQLIPTNLRCEEEYALSNLSGELASITRGDYWGKRFLHETIADFPRKAYSYYNERLSQKFFLFNILVAADDTMISPLVSSVKGDIVRNISDTVSLDHIRIDKGSELKKDFFNLPWNINQYILSHARNESVWNGSIYQPVNLYRLPSLLCISETKKFFRLPIDDGLICGLKSNKIANDNEVIPEIVRKEDEIILGHLFDDKTVQIGLAMNEFTQHALIVGAPGNGKTTFAINILLQFYQKGIPFLIIEPTKTEYRSLLDHIPNLQIFTPGKSDITPFIINPFIPPKSIRVEQYKPALMSAFKAALPMEAPLEFIYRQAIDRCYSRYGWKNTSTSGDKDVQPFGLFEFVLIFKEIIEDSEYKPDVKNNIETGGTFRLLNLISQNKRIFDTINTIPIDELLSCPTLVELNAVPDKEQKALIMALLLIATVLYTKELGSSDGQIKNLLMIDEAHVLLDPDTNSYDSSTKAQQVTVKALQSMIAEIRSYGTGVIIADQKPSKVTSDIVSDTNIKVGFRIVEQSERSIFANSTTMTQLQSEHLARLSKFEAFLYCQEISSPKLIITPNIRITHTIRSHIDDEEVRTHSSSRKMKQTDLVPFFECHYCEQCGMKYSCNYDVREAAERYAEHICSAQSNKIKNVETLGKYVLLLHELVIAYERQTRSGLPVKMLCNCTKIHFLRQILLENNFTMRRKDIAKLLQKVLFKGDI